jgi:hypothetical protein
MHKIKTKLHIDKEDPRYFYIEYRPVHIKKLLASMVICMNTHTPTPPPPPPPKKNCNEKDISVMPDHVLSFAD